MKTREDFNRKKGFIIVAVLAVSLAAGLGGGAALKYKKAESKSMVSAKETVKELSVKAADGWSFKRDSFLHKTEAPDYAKSTETVSQAADNAGSDASNADTGNGAENTGNTENTSTSNPSAGNTSASVDNKNSVKKSGVKTNIKSASNSSGNKSQPAAQQTQPAAQSQPAAQQTQSSKSNFVVHGFHIETRRVCVQEAYDEPVYETHVVGTKCNTCGQVFKNDAEFEAHSKDMAFNHNDYTHGSNSCVYGNILVRTIHHDAVYKTQTVEVDDLDGNVIKVLSETD